MPSLLPILAAGDPGYTPVNNAPSVRVDIAFNAGYTTAAVDRVWTDVSDYVELAQGINIERGRQDQHSQVQPSRLSLTLDNKDGRFTPEYVTGAYYPNVKKGRPVRVSAMTVLGVTAVLFTGYVDEWPVAWPTGGDSYSSVRISATSRMARLGKSAEFKSIVEEEILYDAPVLYYTLGEPSGSTTAGNIAPGWSKILTVTQVGSGGTLEFGAGTGPPTDGLTAPVFTPASAGNGKFLRLAPPQPLTGPPGVQFLELECFFNTSTAVAQVLCSLPYSTDRLTSGVISLTLTSAGEVVAFAQASPNAVATTPSGGFANGATHHAVAIIGINGTNVTPTLIVDGVTTTGATRTWEYVSGGAAFFPSFPYLSVGAYADGTNLFTGTIAHVAVSWQATTSITTARFQDHYNAGANGFTADSSDARIARYARLAGIPTAEVSTEAGLSTSIAHKDSTGQSPLTMMQAVAETEDGVLFDAGDGTLTFHSRSHRYGSVSAFTLSCTTEEIGPDILPRLDDQHLTNDMTASRPNGVTVRSVNQASTDENGYYRDSVEVLTTSDNEVQSRADWQVNRFGTPRATVPNVRVDLITCTPALQASLLQATVGTRFTLSGLPAQAPSASMDLFVEGITYDISDETFTVEFNTSRTEYANVWILDSSSFSQLDSTTVLAY